MAFEDKTRFPYEYDSRKSFNGPELLREYRHRFPLLAIVTEGDYGKTSFDDFPDEQVYRIQAYTRQRRVVAKETRVKQGPLQFSYLSVPVDAPYKFCVIKSSKDCTEPLSLSEILDQYKCPIMVKFSHTCLNVRINELLNRTETISNLLILAEYEENFFTGNCLEKGILHPGITMAALSPRIRYAEITGIKGKSQDMFKKHLATLERFLRDNGVTFDKTAGNPAVTRITDEGTGTGNMVPEVVTALIPELKILPPPKLPQRQNSNAEDKKRSLQNRALPPVPSSNQNPKAVAVVSPFRPETHRKHTETSYYTELEDSAYTYLDTAELTKETIQKSLKQKSVTDVKEYLLQLKLQKYADRFEDELIDGLILVDLTEKILKDEFNMSKLETVRLLTFIKTGHIPR